jgi:adenylate cyclase
VPEKRKPSGPARRARRNTRIACVIAALAVLIVSAALALRGAFEPLDLTWQSQLFALRHQAGLDPPRARIVIVAYDEHSDEKLGSSGGWSRETTAQLVDRLHAAGARLIMLDRLYEDTRSGTAQLSSAIRRAGNVILAQEISLGSTIFTSSISLVPLESSIASAARGIGVVNIPPPDNRDSHARYRAYNYWIEDVRDAAGHAPPSFALAAAIALGVRPNTSSPTFLINYAGPSQATYTKYSLSDVLDGTQNLAAIDGAIVAVGDTLSVDKDYFSTPVDSGGSQANGGSDVMPGIELNANALNTILEHDPLQRPGTPTQLLLTFPLAALVAGWAFRARLLTTVLVTACLIVLALSASIAAFLMANMWIDVSAPTVALGFAPLSVLGARFSTEQRAHRELRSLFGRYVAPGVVSRIVDDPDAFGLEGELREITVLFSDIRGFTTLSEGLPPQAIVRLLSRYFTAMVEEIQRQDGTVDKYVGDAVMALFGAPSDLAEPQTKAVRAALAMQQRLRALNEEFASTFGLRIAVGIGLHHGPAAVGVMGAPSKREYSAIGDTVNTASRLESYTKDAGFSIVASAAIVDALAPELVAEVSPTALGDIHVKGRATAVRVYGLGPRLEQPSEGAVAGQT